MRILFLCGSAEPGKDGVGDYTRRLAAELLRQGNECSIIALMDKSVHQKAQEQQFIEGIELTTLRLPYQEGYEKNAANAFEYIGLLKPEWISLQYVPFSFHHKGLSFGLSNALNPLLKGRKLHIMFHELWVGMNNEVSVKLKLWGEIQKLMLASFVRRMHPEVVHTQSSLYQLQLQQMSIDTELLPLFSNIPVVAVEKKEQDIRELNMVVFGGIHPGAPIAAFAKEVAAYSEAKNLTPMVTFIGRCGDEQENWAKALDNCGIAVSILGEQPAMEVSNVLSTADIGIVNTPYHLVEKSGAYAAMKAHGLKVICLSHNWTLRGIVELPKESVKIQYIKGNLPALINQVGAQPINDVKGIAQIFHNRLEL